MVSKASKPSTKSAKATRSPTKISQKSSTSAKKSAAAAPIFISTIVESPARKKVLNGECVQGKVADVAASAVTNVSGSISLKLRDYMCPGTKLLDKLDLLISRP